MQYQKSKIKAFAHLEVIFNQTFNINSVILIEQNEKAQYSSIVTLNSAILKYQCNIKIVQR